MFTQPDTNNLYFSSLFEMIQILNSKTTKSTTRNQGLGQNNMTTPRCTEQEHTSVFHFCLNWILYSSISLVFMMAFALYTR
ncbi:hypothetical protein BD408DRAFT_409478 [Parasitella parasitica]|nr:hypothetical protein BD408DRAFT_409478 [Parasitella parasitica]